MSETDGKPWRVRRVGSVYEDFASEQEARDSANRRAGLGFEIKVEFWNGASWEQQEHISLRASMPFTEEERQRSRQREADREPEAGG